MPPINQMRLGSQMPQQAPQLPLDFLMNQQPQQQGGGGIPFADISSLLQMLQVGGSAGLSTPMGGGDLGTSQNLGLLSREMSGLNPSNIGSMVGSGLNTQMATPGLLYAMQGMGGI
jgi:hypothetical protein